MSRRLATTLVQISSFSGGGRNFHSRALERDVGPDGLGYPRLMGKFRGRCGRSVNELLAAERLCVSLRQVA